MVEAVPRDAQQLALDVHALLVRIDGPKIRAHNPADLRAQVESIASKATDVLGRWPEDTHAKLRSHLESVLATAENVPRAVDADPSAWVSFRRTLLVHYEDLAKSLRDVDVRVPNTRPGNLSRSFFHAASGLGGVVLIERVLDERSMILVAAVLAGWAWSMEAFRRLFPSLNRLLMSTFRSVAHPHETHLINSGTWYLTALLILSLTASPLVCSVAVTVLAVGDPAAALIGRRFGRRKLVQGRSLEGSLAFLVFGAISAWIVLATFHPALPIVTRLSVSALSAFAGAVAEVVCRKIDDNFAIPLASAAVTAATLALLS